MFIIVPRDGEHEQVHGRDKGSRRNYSNDQQIEAKRVHGAS
jgi:hypothetical protein